ncbi:ATP-binding protein [Paenibacillus chartarius]|uniref:histidine kinase n=1 Tax=Paenibacillus chartarius TaxID=747481 RepID=A0ABV6DSC0_9BACL
MVDPAKSFVDLRSEAKRVLRHFDASGRINVVLVTPQGFVIAANDSFARSCGCSAAAELSGRPVRELLEWPEGSLPLEERMIPGVGGIVPVEVGGQSAFAVYVRNSLTPEQNRSRALLERFSASFIKDVNLGVLLIDLDYTLLNISDTACRILGYEREEVMFRSLDDIFAHVPVQHRLVQRTILDGVIVRNHAVSWANAESRYDLLLDSNVLRGEDGRIVGAYVMFKDVTHLRSLEAQVQRSDRLAMIGQIAAGTAHEIRNPLTSIKGFLQILKSTFEDREMLKERSFTEVMLTEIDRINELVSEFLLLSKPREATLSEVDIQVVLEGILPIIRNEALLHGTEVKYVPLQGGLPSVIADQELLKQVFLNISKNGIEAMGEGGVLTIVERLDPLERKVLIDIHDTGPGIPLFLVDKIFDPFFTTKEEGTGLGLSVCQRIVHDIGGTIRVSSKGYGTTFTVGIPFS